MAAGAPGRAIAGMPHGGTCLARRGRLRRWLRANVDALLYAALVLCANAGLAIGLLLGEDALVGGISCFCLAGVIFVASLGTDRTFESLDTLAG